MLLMRSMMYENEIYIHEDVSAQIYDAAVRANYRGHINNPPVIEGYRVAGIDFGPDGEHEVLIHDPQGGTCRALFYEHDNRWEYYTVEEDEHFVAWSVDGLAHLINDEYVNAA